LIGHSQIQRMIIYLFKDQNNFDKLFFPTASHIFWLEWVSATCGLIYLPLFHIECSGPRKVVFPLCGGLLNLGLHPWCLYVLYFEHAHHIHLCILWPGVNISDQFFPVSFSFFQDCWLDISFLFAIVVTVALVLNGHTWSRSQELENYLTACPLCPLFIDLALYYFHTLTLVVTWLKYIHAIFPHFTFHVCPGEYANPHLI
jgi:hypothetical protein